MKFSKQQLAVMVTALRSMPLSKEEKTVVSEVLSLLIACSQDGMFIDGEVDLKTPQKALILKVLESAKWTAPEWEFVDTLISLLN